MAGKSSDQFEIVQTRGGAFAVFDRESKEIMHPVGPLVESRSVYLEPSRLSARLKEQSEEPLVLWDVGLGAGSNAQAAWLLSEARDTGRPLHIVSFDRTLEAMRIACAPEHAAAFGWDGPVANVARALLTQGDVQGQHTRWTFVLGDLPRTLHEATGGAEVVFWDPFSPKSCPDLWGMQAFLQLRERCAPTATLHTFCAATSVRAALLLAGFAVGTGVATGSKAQTTEAAIRLADLRAPLGARWLARLMRSSAPTPKDAPEEALERIAALPQFRGHPE